MERGNVALGVARALILAAIAGSKPFLSPSAGAGAAASSPSEGVRIRFTSSIVGSPPTGQANPSIPPALTHASAKLRQPANPHPPQLAPGSTATTRSMRGSSSTLKIRLTTYSSTAATNPVTPNTPIEIKIRFMLFVILVVSVCYLVRGYIGVISGLHRGYIVSYPYL